MIKSPDIAAGIAYVRSAQGLVSDFGPEKLHVHVENEDVGRHRNMVCLTGIRAHVFAEVFAECDDIPSMLRACLTDRAKEACERAWACVHLGHGAYESFNAFEGMEVDDLFLQSLQDD
jgi:hypothetical protein